MLLGTSNFVYVMRKYGLLRIFIVALFLQCAYARSSPVKVDDPRKEKNISLTLEPNLKQNDTSLIKGRRINLNETKNSNKTRPRKEIKLDESNSTGKDSERDPILSLDKNSTSLESFNSTNSLETKLNKKKIQNKTNEEVGISPSINATNLLNAEQDSKNGSKSNLTTPKMLVNDTSLVNRTVKIDLALDLTIDLVASRGPTEDPSTIGKVLSQGKLSNYFRTCATEEEALADENRYPLKRRSCFRDSEYSNTLEFEYYYPPQKMSGLDLIIATVDLQQTEKLIAVGSVSKPSVHTLSSFEPKRRVTVNYGCVKNGVQSYVLSFVMKNSTNEETIKMSWEKTCLVGTVPNHVIVKSNAPSTESTLWPPNEYTKKIIVAPSQMSTSIEMTLDHRYFQQSFLGPYVVSSDPLVVVPKVRGTESKGGVLRIENPALLNVMYACKGTGSAVISWTSSIPPFSNVSLSWTKECGGVVPHNLNIGTESMKFDIAKKGIVQEYYNMSDWNLGTPHSEAHRHLESNETTWELFISIDNEDQEDDRKSYGIHMGHPLITVDNPSVVYGSTSKIVKSSKHRRRSQYNYNDPTVILRKDEQLEISFSLVCLRLGESRIFISLPLLHYDAVEFGFVKVCNYVPKKKSAFAMTVRNVFRFLVFMCATLGAIYAFKLYKDRQNRIRYEGLTSTG